MNHSRLAGFACAIGGTWLFCDLTLHLLSGLGRVYFLLAILGALCFAGGAFGLRKLRLLPSGWPRVVGGLGFIITLLGVGLWVIAFTTLFLQPGMAFIQRLTPAGSLLLSLGMILNGAAVVPSPRLHGWRRFVPLLVGLYFPLQLIFQLAFFLNGRDATPGPNGMLLGSWGLLWLLLGVVIVTTPDEAPPGLSSPASP